MITALNVMFDKHIETLCYNINKELQNMQTQFAKSIQSVECFHEQKLEELKQCEIDCIRMEEEQEKNRELLNWIADRINALDKSLEI